MATTKPNSSISPINGTHTITLSKSISGSGYTASGSVYYTKNTMNICFCGKTVTLKYWANFPVGVVVSAGSIEENIYMGVCSGCNNIFVDKAIYKDLSTQSIKANTDTSLQDSKDTDYVDLQL